MARNGRDYPTVGRTRGGMWAAGTRPAGRAAGLLSLPMAAIALDAKVPHA